MKIPTLTRDLGLDFWWDTQKLWGLDLPTEEMNVSEFEWMLELPFWKLDGQEFAVTPIQVMKDKRTYRDQYERTLNADLSYPIHALYINNRWVIMDGIHRLLKAKILYKRTIQVKKMLRKHIPYVEIRKS